MVWTSFNTDDDRYNTVVSVDYKGVVTTKTSGQATITATSAVTGNEYATCIITVAP